MTRMSALFQNKYYLEIIISLSLFIYALITDSIVLVLINVLYFIIFLEVVRAVVGFIREQRVKINILIDAFIILTLREFIVNVMKINKEPIHSFDDLLTNTTNFHILIFSGVLVFLFFIRWLAIKTRSVKASKQDD